MQQVASDRRELAAEIVSNREGRKGVYERHAHWGGRRKTQWKCIAKVIFLSVIADTSTNPSPGLLADIKCVACHC